MTFTVQEVPEWNSCDISEKEFEMFDLNLPDILNDKEQCLVGVVPEEIKVEDPYFPTSSLMAAQPGFDESYNAYLQQDAAAAAQQQQNLVTSDAYYYSDNSSYSGSPMQPQMQQQHQPPQGMTANDLLGYQQQPSAHRQMQQAQMMPPHPQLHRLPPAYSSVQVVPQQQQQVNEYGYYNYYTGKRRLRDDELNPADYEKRRMRRERNKEAALRCRNRRRERIDALEKETNEIEQQNEKVEIDIAQLQKQIEELKTILKGHNCKSTE